MVKLGREHFILIIFGIFLILLANLYIGKSEILYSNQDIISDNAKINFTSDKSDAVLKIKFKKIPREAIFVELNQELLESFSPRSRFQIIPLKNLANKNSIRIYSAEKFEIQKVEVESGSGIRNTLKIIFSIIGAFLIFLPLLLTKYQEFCEIEEREEKFSEFLYDIMESIRSGMSITQAIKVSRNNDYGFLTDNVKKLAAKIDWGINLNKALEFFATETKSKYIKRAVRTIMQSYYSGGDIADILEAVAENMREVRRLKRERQLELYSELLTSYVVFLVFLASISIFSKYILPSFSATANIQPISEGGESVRVLIASYRQIFSIIILIQALFSGLIIGKLIYGSYKAGIKHAAILLAIGYISISLFL